MLKPIIAANWKMYKTVPEAVEFVEQLTKNLYDVYHCEIVICAPFTALYKLRESIKNTSISLGAQNMFYEEKGAYTGEISPKMLQDIGCNYVIVGHSERRQYFSETDEIVNKKMLSAFKFNLIPIVCIGETLQEREAGITFNVLEKQIKVGLSGLNSSQAEKLVIAYEPVWAIGTGRTATPVQAQESHKFIRKLYADIYGYYAAENLRILYGGSIKPENIKELMEQEDINGGLVGGASLELDSFVKIVRYK